MACGLAGGSGDSYKRLHAAACLTQKGPGRTSTFYSLSDPSSIRNHRRRHTARHRVTALQLSFPGNEAAGKRLEVVDAEGLSCEEIGTRLQLSSGAVRTTLCRARQRLRTEYVALGGEPAAA